MPHARPQVTHRGLPACPAPRTDRKQRPRGCEVAPWPAIGNFGLSITSRALPPLPRYVDERTPLVDDVSIHHEHHVLVDPAGVHRRYDDLMLTRHAHRAEQARRHRSSRSRHAGRGPIIQATCLIRSGDVFSWELQPGNLYLGVDAPTPLALISAMCAGGLARTPPGLAA
jgi:hypothetical protein